MNIFFLTIGLYNYSFWYNYENRVSKAYWIWAQFDVETMKTLRQIQAATHKLLGGPTFDIHLTISSPLKKFDYNTLKTFQGLKDKLQPMTLTLNKYDFSDKFYESLFVSVRKSQDLVHFKKTVDNAFETTSLAYHPHISLYYGRATQQEKTACINALPKLPEKIRLTKLCLVNVDEDVDAWTIEHEISLS